MNNEYTLLVVTVDNTFGVAYVVKDFRAECDIEDEIYRAYHDNETNESIDEEADWLCCIIEGTLINNDMPCFTQFTDGECYTISHFYPINI